jgi:di/tripeptidase
MLTDKKIKLIQEFQAQMGALQGGQTGEVIDKSKAAAAYSAMVLGINEEDISAFNKLFPETPIGRDGF